MLTALGDLQSSQYNIHRDQSILKCSSTKHNTNIMLSRTHERLIIYKYQSILSSVRTGPGPSTGLLWSNVALVRSWTIFFPDLVHAQHLQTLYYQLQVTNGLYGSHTRYWSPAMASNINGKCFCHPFLHYYGKQRSSEIKQKISK